MIFQGGYGETYRIESENIRLRLQKHLFRMHKKRADYYVEVLLISNGQGGYLAIFPMNCEEKVIDFR